MKARPYQQKAIDEVRNIIGLGKKRALIQMSTGGGKTYIFSTILKGCHEKNTPCIMVVQSRHLVDQASERLKSMGVPHGVLMANHVGYDISKAVQIASIDTCNRRKIYPKAAWVILDEAHTAVSDKFKTFLSHYEDSNWVSVTATPWVDSGLEHLSADVVYPISFSELVAQGYLVPAKYFVPSKFDVSGIRTSKGEYRDDDAIMEFESQSIYGDVIASYNKLCVGQCTWVFAINIEHANKIKDSFDGAGIRSVVITGDTSLEERKAILDTEDLVISVGTLTTGVDVPRLRNVILCRPTKSKNLYIQILGRGTRPHEGKTHFKVIDHCGNVSRHGFIELERKADLKPKIKKSKSSVDESSPPIKVCPECHSANHAACKECAECGFEFKAEKRVILEFKSGDMIELSAENMDQAFRYRCEYHFNVIWKYDHSIYAMVHRLKEDFGEEIYKKYKDIHKEFVQKYENRCKNYIIGGFKPRGWGKTYY